MRTSSTLVSSSQVLGDASVGTMKFVKRERWFSLESLETQKQSTWISLAGLIERNATIIFHTALKSSLEL